ncbi:hypothetical protein DOZ80_27765 [Pseudomonas fluorescens]|uniref:Uncharacterized protein n=1 Tax=Pseudomonas fluorescens TaxID=294 RepID=A0A327ML47_PSEFL|nr:hypothetical protein DOZ80_27765 [Pseudomonas fluorescens]
MTGLTSCAGFVGASLLAKNVNDNECLLVQSVIIEIIASKLAPTEAFHGRKKTGHLWPVSHDCGLAGLIKRRIPAASCRWP